MTTPRLPPRSIQSSGARKDRCHRRLVSGSIWRGAGFAGRKMSGRRCDGATASRCAACSSVRLRTRSTQLTDVERRRIERASTREAAVSRLERALREGPDREVVAALAEFESAGAPFPDVLDWTAVRGVVDRISLAEALRAAASADPPDTAQLARLLPAARAALGDRGMPGEPDWAALEQSVMRAAHLARLREAIADEDEARIAFAAVPDPFGALQSAHAGRTRAGGRARWSADRIARAKRSAEIGSWRSVTARWPRAGDADAGDAVRRLYDGRHSASQVARRRQATEVLTRSTPSLAPPSRGSRRCAPRRRGRPAPRIPLRRSDRG